jgi:hypothetical protein
LSIPRRTAAAIISITALLTACQTASRWLKPDVAAGAVLFQDDFTRTTSGWDRYKDEAYSANYFDGAYQINISVPNTQAWARPHLEFNDVRVEVMATKNGGPDDNMFGVICRYQDAHNFYFFSLSSDGYAGIGVYRDGKERIISARALHPSSQIQTGDSSNHIRADCIGTQLALYINGSLTTQASISNAQPGDVGLIAGAYENADVEIRFDQFSVIKP